MDWILAIWGAITLLSILGALSLLDMAGEFHQRGLERVRRAGCFVCGDKPALLDDYLQEYVCEPCQIGVR